MTFDIYELLDKGFLVFFAVVVLFFIFRAGRLISKYLPAGIESAREIVNAWKEIASAMRANAIAIDKNTNISHNNHKQSAIVLEELRQVNEKFNEHDLNAVEIRNKVEEQIKDLIKLIEKQDNSEEILELLKIIIDKLEEESWYERK